MSKAANATRETGVETVQEPGSGLPEARNAGQIVLLTILESGRSLAVLLAIAIFAITFIVQPFQIPSASMERTLLVGDFLLVNKAVYGPRGHFGWLLPYRQVQRGDIVVFHFPLNPAEHVVKRVIGVPGDRIHLKNGVVYRNGQALNEPYVLKEAAWPDSFRDNFPGETYTDPEVNVRWWDQVRSDERGGDLIVPAGEYFVLGDNRDDSRDSRYWGFVPRRNIVGRPLLIYFSLRRSAAGELRASTGVAGGLNAVIAGGQDDRLEHEGTLDRIVDFARWTRILRVVR